MRRPLQPWLRRTSVRRRRAVRPGDGHRAELPAEIVLAIIRLLAGTASEYAGAVRRAHVQVAAVDVEVAPASSAEVRRAKVASAEKPTCQRTKPESVNADKCKNEE